MNGKVRLYLSSYRIGSHGPRLVRLVGGEMRAFVIMNGLDASSPSTRRETYERTRGDLMALGFDVRELDLRDYFESSDGLAGHLRECDLVWANGGNAFTLNMALRQSGFASRLKRSLESGAVAYGGYSAGAVVAGDTLRGIELVDSAEPAEAVPPRYRAEISWEGLGLVDYAIVPHYRSDHRESAKIEDVVRYCVKNGIRHRTLRDGEVIVDRKSVV